MHKLQFDRSLPSTCPRTCMPSPENDRHQHVRDVALSLFASAGYANVSLRQLAEGVGLHVGSLYNHIESKQALLFELIRDHLENLLDHVEWQVKKRRGVEARLHAFIASYIDFQLLHKEHAQLSALELRNLDPEQLHEIAELYKSYRGRLEAIINEGVKTGLFFAHPLSAATHGILGMLSSIAFWFTEDAPLSKDQLISQYSAMVRCSLRMPSSLSPSVA
ncbi:TetR/AcrR family transcriptional regulator [Pseudomonas sp. MBLB4136]|uniref:TetR/AcrR family transcriptional regulator n=1 Tax=Pseudomonas sp. MBLB4136 TaxID=3451558 RepID=UPI003F74D0EC